MDGLGNQSHNVIRIVIDLKMYYKQKKILAECIGTQSSLSAVTTTKKELFPTSGGSFTHLNIQ
jgi:hypothetical protein